MAIFICIMAQSQSPAMTPCFNSPLCSLVRKPFSLPAALASDICNQLTQTIELKNDQISRPKFVFTPVICNKQTQFGTWSCFNSRSVEPTTSSKLKGSQQHFATLVAMSLGCQRPIKNHEKQGPGQRVIFTLKIKVSVFHSLSGNPECKLSG